MQCWKLHLGEEVQSNQAAMILLCEKNLDEVCEHSELLSLAADEMPVHRGESVWLARGTAALDEELFEYPLGNSVDREMIHRTAHVTSAVAILKSSHQNGVERCARHNSELATQ